MISSIAPSRDEGDAEHAHGAPAQVVRGDAQALGFGLLLVEQHEYRQAAHAVEGNGRTGVAVPRIAGGSPCAAPMPVIACMTGTSSPPANRIRPLSGSAIAAAAATIRGAQHRQHRGGQPAGEIALQRLDAFDDEGAFLPPPLGHRPGRRRAGGRRRRRGGAPSRLPRRELSAFLGNAKGRP
jgi:hypothetical protein